MNAAHDGQSEDHGQPRGRFAAASALHAGPLPFYNTLEIKTIEELLSETWERYHNLESTVPWREILADDGRSWEVGAAASPLRLYPRSQPLPPPHTMQAALSDPPCWETPSVPRLALEAIPPSWHAAGTASYAERRDFLPAFLCLGAIL